jgi:hypothetical protein
MTLCKNLPIVGHFVHPYLSMQLMRFLSNRGTQLVCLGLKTRYATDTLEAVTLGCNWYTFLTAGRNSYFPLKIWEPKSPGTLWAIPGLLRDSFYLLYTPKRVTIICRWFFACIKSVGQKTQPILWSFSFTKPYKNLYTWYEAIKKENTSWPLGNEQVITMQ